MKIALTNLSNKLFQDSRSALNVSALKFGIENVFSYDFDSLKGTCFYINNRTILSQSKGLGYWLWKPYIILEAFNKLDEGDVVVYSDCGIEIIKNIQPLIDICLYETDIVLFANSNYTNKIWTKRDCFVLMGCNEDKYWNGIHCDAAFSLFKKTDKSIRFVKEWLSFGCNENIITDLPNVCGSPDFPEFMDHRWDQSILSLLAIKHGIAYYRMPTQFGNHYKLPQFRIPGEFNCINQGDRTPLDHYSSTISTNSPYLQLLNHHRKKTVLENKEKVSPQNGNRTEMKFESYIKRGIRKISRSKDSVRLIKQNPHQKSSYSQCGEDLIVQYIFNLRGVKNPTYIDIGANHPHFLSNTAMFYEKGSRGINIEANPLLMNDFITHRPEDINLNIGISDSEGEFDFYIMKDNTLSTFSKVESDFMVSHGKELAEIRKVKLTTMSNILEKYLEKSFPDFMSIDVEGMDFQILRSIDFSNSFPKIICVEAAEYSPIGAGARRNELIDFLVSKGYYEYANTNLNAIMVKNEFWFI